MKRTGIEYLDFDTSEGPPSGELYFDNDYPEECCESKFITSTDAEQFFSLFSVEFMREFMYSSDMDDLSMLDQPWAVKLYQDLRDVRYISWVEKKRGEGNLSREDVEYLVDRAGLTLFDGWCFSYLHDLFNRAPAHMQSEPWLVNVLRGYCQWRKRAIRLASHACAVLEEQVYHMTDADWDADKERAEALTLAANKLFLFSCHWCQVNSDTQAVVCAPHNGSLSVLKKLQGAELLEVQRKMQLVVDALGDPGLVKNPDVWPEIQRNIHYSRDSEDEHDSGDSGLHSELDSGLGSALDSDSDFEEHNSEEEDSGFEDDSDPEDEEHNSEDEDSDSEEAIPAADFSGL